MLKSIRIEDFASYRDVPVVLDGLTRRNYFYGSNGSGKSTIGKVIDRHPCVPASCAIEWDSVELETRVYNRDFVKHNFGPDEELRGVFTLGEDSLETKALIADKKKQDAERAIALANQMAKIDEFVQQLHDLEDDLNERCWEQKVKHEDFKDAFTGYMNSKESFKAGVIAKRSSTAVLLTLEELTEKALTVFGETPEQELPVALLQCSSLVAHEKSELLTTKVLGKEDVTVAELIQELGNSDWVRSGREYLKSEDGKCPFCQQDAPKTLEQDLDDYFDETFTQQADAFAAFVDTYQADANSVQDAIALLLATTNTFLVSQLETLKTTKEALDAKVVVNMGLLNSKKAEPSKAVELVSLSEPLELIQGLVKSANEKTKAHNITVDNLKTERDLLTAQVWKYLVETELKLTLETYDTKKKTLNAALVSLKEAAKLTQEQRRVLQDEIRVLEETTTSIQPTVDGINKLLTNLGFRGFSIATAEDGKSYKLIREDESEVEDTLSEGERSFVTFLYFYYLLKGGHVAGETTVDKVVVFDDPVSSLDSDALFVVSSLIREICDEAGSGEGNIKQAFVLTHNVHFHRAVTHGVDSAKGSRSFWLVRKPDGITKVEKRPSNPVKTSYLLLWEELHRPDCTDVTVQNAMRRILEHYFKTLGGVKSLDDLLLSFNGEERLACRSLISWVHDGSHSIHEDMYVCVGDSCVEMYLNVFRAIFDKRQQLGHYDMMWVESGKSVGDTAAAVAAMPVATAAV